MKVVGYCPMGCGTTLFLGDGGHVTCSWHACPAPGAVDEILTDAETEHVAEFGEERFHLQHPLRERLNGDLFRCDVHKVISAMSAPPCRPGRYRVTAGDAGFLYEELD